MHEISIAESIVSLAVDAARARTACAITRVELRIGALQQVVPEALEVAFRAAAAGTPACCARLEWSLEAAVVECPACGMTYTPEDIFWICPACAAPGGCVVRGDDLLLVAVDIETAEDPAERT